jgi:HEAT repeat protein
MATALPAGAARAASETDSALAIRTALERGAVAAVDLLGRTDGFLGNPKVRIPLPGVLEDAAGMLRALGQQRRVDELVTAMNRAAEAAVPEARQLLVSTVKALSVEDAVRIVSGGDDAATKFFAGKTREPLTERFLPIVGRATEKVKLAAKYDAVAGRAAKLGLVKADDADLKRYVTGRALDGLYLMIGEEERKIRRDPVGTGSAILKKVFGGLR